MKTISVDDDSAEALLKVLRRAIRREAVEPEELPHVMAVIHALIRSEEEPAHSTACPNATETCSTTCPAWEGQTCNCKVAPPAVDLGAVAWELVDELEAHALRSGLTLPNDVTRWSAAAVNILSGKQISECDARTLRERLAARGKVAT